ncbi:MFS general substrate transporter [Wolfiporia cocos MD-104 SS10]|uniref:MFS general substrate transporter n=1 Tax=Wolfiporia cocos (strain MD-104) TaxID=742152 RepID=A0A2H3JP92_WOLCO|nr:MFS general substrate transporter [Wolfiporia cocos MD-104 SS10]
MYEQATSWWKRPSPWWFLAVIPFASLARAATAAPRVELYIELVCDAYKPDTTIGRIVQSSSLLPMLPMLKEHDRWDICSSDPIVQAAVAKLSLAMTTSMGILGCLTTAWWGSLSDRYGRTTIVTFSIIGLLMEDLAFILVCNFSELLPGGYWFLTLGPVLAGMLGGLNAVSAGAHAYIADCTDPTTRSRYFSLFIGLLFMGFSFGPTLGSILISYTGQPLSVFYVAAVLHMLYAVFVYFFVPESLTTQQMSEFKCTFKSEMKERRDARSKGGPLMQLGRAFGFLRPLALLLPGVVEEKGSGKRKRSWNLLLLAAGYGCTIALKGDITYEYQYMSLTFGWTSEQLGYYTSALGATRAIYLTVLLPVIMKLLQPKLAAVRLPDEAYDHPQTSQTSNAEQPQARAEQAATPHSSTLDLALARISILIEVVAYIMMALAPNGYVFTAYAVFSALGVGFTPAINSVASALYTQNGGKELGKLFGALGVVQTICSQVLGPFLFGVTYMKTVATAPKAIFAVSVAALTTSFLLLAPIRLQTRSGGTSDVDLEQNESLPDERTPLVRGVR